MRVATLCAALLLVPVAFASGSGSTADAPDDQGSSSAVPGARCRDLSLEVTESGVALDGDALVAHFRVADAEAAFACEPSAVDWRRAQLRSFHVYTEDYPLNGYYVHWSHDEFYGGGKRVTVYDPRTGVSERLPVVEERDGNVYRVSVPVSGNLTDRDGNASPYTLREPLRHYGVTEGWYGVGAAWATVLRGVVTTEDRFGDTFGA